MNNLPFSGLKVIDMTWSGAGAFIINLLGHYGAFVIRVESARQPDPVRRVYTYTDATRDSPHPLDRSAVFAFTHSAPKYDMTLDLKNPAAKELFKKLVAWADLLGESFPTGVMERFGFGYEELKKIKPDIIMIRSCGYGHTGPLAHQAGFGMTLAAYSMMYSVAGWPDRPSVPVSSYYSDQLAPLYSMLAMVAALDNRRRTGKGQCIDQSQIESTLNYLGPVVLDYSANNRELSLTGNQCSYAAPHGVYRCKNNNGERWVAIAVFTDQEWQALCWVAGPLPWTQDPRFATISGRIQYRDELDKLVESWTIDYSPEQVMSILQAAGVGAGVVANAQDIVEDVQLKYYNFFRKVEHPYMGQLTYAHPAPLKLSEAESLVGPPPVLGAQNEYVCRQILGLSQEEYAQLVQAKVFE